MAHYLSEHEPQLVDCFQDQKAKSARKLINNLSGNLVVPVLLILEGSWLHHKL